MGRRGGGGGGENSHIKRTGLLVVPSVGLKAVLVRVLTSKIPQRELPRYLLGY